MINVNLVLVKIMYVQGFIQGGGGTGGVLTPQSKCQEGYLPHFFTYLLKLIAYKKVILYWKNNPSSVFLHHNKIRLGFIDFHSDSTASKLTSSSCGPSMAIIISFDSEEG